MDSFTALKSGSADRHQGVGRGRKGDSEAENRKSIGRPCLTRQTDTDRLSVMILANLTILTSTGHHFKMIWAFSSSLEAHSKIHNFLQIWLTFVHPSICLSIHPFVYVHPSVRPFVCPSEDDNCCEQCSHSLKIWNFFGFGFGYHPWSPEIGPLVRCPVWTVAVITVVKRFHFFIDFY